MSWLWKSSLITLFALAGCDSGDGSAQCSEVADTDGESTSPLVCAATPGGDGGEPGSVLMVVGPQADEEALRVALTDVVVGRGGVGGRGGLGGRGSDGLDGESATQDADTSVARTDFAFDAAAIEPETYVDIAGSDGDNVVAIPEPVSPPQLAVEEFRIRAGARFALTCDARIVADRFVVEAGATLVLQGRNASGCVLGVEAAQSEPSPRETGQRGLSAFIEARSFELDGTINLAGGRGFAGQPGGAGGRLTVRAESVTLGEQAAIFVSGGDGGDGVDEGQCS